MGHSVSHLYRTWEKGLPPPRSDKDYSDVKQTLWTEIALIAFSQDGMHKTQEMKRHFQPGEEYVHYTIIWGNCVLTWCYFSLALSLKSNDKTPKKPKNPKSVNQGKGQRKPAAHISWTRRMWNLLQKNKDTREGRDLKLVSQTDLPRQGRRQQAPGVCEDSWRKSKKDIPPSTSSIPQTGKINQCEWPECNIPKKDIWE